MHLQIVVAPVLSPSAAPRLQVCVQICLRNRTAQTETLLAGGCELLRKALDLWTMLFQPHCPFHSTVNLQWYAPLKLTPKICLRDSQCFKCASDPESLSIYS